MANKLWVIETKMRTEQWIPIMAFFIPEGVLSGVHYTRRRARAAKKVIMATKNVQRLQYRVKKYEAAE